MLSQYKNINQIINANYALIGDRFDLTDHNLIDDAISLKQVPNIGNGQVELHLYSNQTWITGNHNVIIKNNVTLNTPNTQGNIDLGLYPFAIEIYKELKNLNLNSGNFRIVVNCFNNLIGNYNNPFIFIDEISPDRTELKLRITKLDDVINRLQVTDFIKKVHQPIDITNTPKYVSHQLQDPMHKTYLLNFSRNKILKFINSVVIDGEFLYVKLQDPAPDFIIPKLKCWVTEELRYPYIDRIAISSVQPDPQFNKLSTANWDAYKSYNVSSETGVKNWNDLLGSSVQTSQQIVDSYFSSGLSGIKLNIDYSDFNNFIFYSSAEERLNNFKYKLELLEYYTNKIVVLNSISGSTATTNIDDYTLNKTKLINGFDTFENYLYYQSSSRLHTYDLPHESPNVAALTGSYITPAPKSNSTYPYTLYPVTSSQFESWYDNLITSASYYDSLNLNKLVNTLPLSITSNESNSDVITFVNMLGHHFDLLYTYINHMSTINKREENPKLGMPNELLYSVAKQFGWSLQDGSQHQDLWQYTLGTNSAGVPLTGSTSVGDPSTPGREMTHAIWRRIVNNLPLLLKSKGTKRSVQALLSCYGIPHSLISINEYGAASSDKIPVYEKLSFDYALDLINNSTGTVNINYTSPVNALELRFKTDNVVTYPTLPSTMNLITIIGSQLNVILNYTRGTLGTLTIYDHNFNTATTGEIELFDGNWLSMLVRKNGTNLDLYVKKAKYGKIVAAVSASMTGSIPAVGTVILGTTDAGASRFRGQLQELRLWSSSLNVTAFDTHVKAPSVYVANTNAYDELLYRLPLTYNINHTLTSSLSGIQPVASTISASFSNWSTSYPYNSNEETHYYESLSVGYNTYDDNKIRIESNELVGSLDIKTRAEVSQYDIAPLDSNRVGVYYSPQTMIDEDIMSHLGYVNLGDYIGDIDTNTNKTSYPSLQLFANQYWKKRKTKNDINSYIKMFTSYDMSFFNQLDQLLPARADNLTGLVIQPTLLERSKDSILTSVSYKSISFNGSTSLLPNSSVTSTVILPPKPPQLVPGLQPVVVVMPIVKNIGGVVIPNPIGGAPLIQNPYNIPPKFPPIIPPPHWSTQQPVNITGSISYPDKKEIKTFISGGLSYKRYIPATANVYRPTGYNNGAFNGSKVTSPDFNLPSPHTVDGKPVIELTTVKTGQLQYVNGIANNGSFATATTKKTIWNFATAQKAKSYRDQSPLSNTYTKSLYE
jgi:hypothetical protein